MDEPPERGSLRPLYTEKVGKSFKEGTRDGGRGTGDGGRGTWGVGRGTWDEGRGTRDVERHAYCLLFTVYCSLFAPAYAKASAGKIHYSLFAIRYSLLPQLNF